MFNTLLNSMYKVGMLLLVLILISLANIVLENTYIIYIKKKPLNFKNIKNKLWEDFFTYIGVAILSLGVIILPLVLKNFGFSNLINHEVIETFSSTAIDTLIISTVVIEGTKALNFLKKLWSKEEIDKE